MTGNEQFKRYVEAGTAFVGMTQQRAEALVKDLVGSGEMARGQAQKAVDWLVERGQRGSEELTAVIKREVRSQIDSLGLATKDDIARLEAKLAGPPRSSPADPKAKAGRAAKVAPAARRSTKTAPSAERAPAARVAPMAKASSRSGKAAPITKAASTRRPRTQPPPAPGR